MEEDAAITDTFSNEIPTESASNRRSSRSGTNRDTRRSTRRSHEGVPNTTSTNTTARSHEGAPHTTSRSHEGAPHSTSRSHEGAPHTTSRSHEGAPHTTSRSPGEDSRSSRLRKKVLVTYVSEENEAVTRKKTRRRKRTKSAGSPPPPEICDLSSKKRMRLLGAGSLTLAGQPRKRLMRCGQCGPCQADNCGECIHCLHRATMKQACIHRKCLVLEADKEERKRLKAEAKPGRAANHFQKTNTRTRMLQNSKSRKQLSTFHSRKRDENKQFQLQASGADNYSKQFQREVLDHQCCYCSDDFVSDNELEFSISPWELTDEESDTEVAEAPVYVSRYVSDVRANNVASCDASDSCGKNTHDSEGSVDSRPAPVITAPARAPASPPSVLSEAYHRWRENWTKLKEVTRRTPQIEVTKCDVIGEGLGGELRKELNVLLRNKDLALLFDNEVEKEGYVLKTVANKLGLSGGMVREWWSKNKVVKNADNAKDGNSEVGSKGLVTFGSSESASGEMHPKESGLNQITGEPVSNETNSISDNSSPPRSDDSSHGGISEGRERSDGSSPRSDESSHGGISEGREHSEEEKINELSKTYNIVVLDSDKNTCTSSDDHLSEKIVSGASDMWFTGNTSKHSKVYTSVRNNGKIGRSKRSKGKKVKNFKKYKAMLSDACDPSLREEEIRGRPSTEEDHLLGKKGTTSRPSTEEDHLLGKEGISSRLATEEDHLLGKEGISSRPSTEEDHLLGKEGTSGRPSTEEDHLLGKEGISSRLATEEDHLLGKEGISSRPSTEEDPLLGKEEEDSTSASALLAKINEDSLLRFDGDKSGFMSSIIEDNLMNFDYDSYSYDDSENDTVLLLGEPSPHEQTALSNPMYDPRVQTELSHPTDDPHVKTALGESTDDPDDETADESPVTKDFQNAFQLFLNRSLEMPVGVSESGDEVTEESGGDESAESAEVGASESGDEMPESGDSAESGLVSGESSSDENRNSLGRECYVSLGNKVWGAGERGVREGEGQGERGEGVTKEEQKLNNRVRRYSKRALNR